MSKTVEEKFLIKLFETAKAEGDFDSPLNALQIGRSIGQRDRSIQTTIRLLAQANFIKKIDDDIVILTDHGKSLAKSLLK